MTASLLFVAEPEATAILLLLFGVLLASSVILSRTVDRIGVPVVLLFLVLGMVGGSEGLGRLAFDDFSIAVRIGTLALVLILFDGGLSTSLASVRHAAGPASVLATLGVLISAGAVAVFAHLLGLAWGEAALLGAVVSSTDAAAVFSVLRGGGLHLRPRVGHTLELESCVNDPMAVILTTAVIDILNGGQRGWLSLALAVPVQLIVGTLVGIACGAGTVSLLKRVRLTTAGLYPVLTLAVALLAFGSATVLHGSGFLAVFAAGVTIGNARLPFHTAMTRIHDAFAWLGQVSMFLMLGLLVFPSQLLSVAPLGLAVAVFLAVVARPLAALVCLLPFRFPFIDAAYIGWNGLRGAVPIVLATFPVLAGVDPSHRVFNLVFFIVVMNSLIPGATIRWVTRRLKLTVPHRPRPQAALEINSLQPLNGELSVFHVEHSVAVCDTDLRDIEFPSGASVALIVRGQELVPARGGTRLREDDDVYVFHAQADRPLLGLLFGGTD